MSSWMYYSISFFDECVQTEGNLDNDYCVFIQVTAALTDAGLESSNLIVGIDFTKSNEWTG